jgi:transcriptional/translational regulatory protein YebC/TACO1
MGLNQGKKGAADANGQAFFENNKGISLAASLEAGRSELNPKLRIAVQNAKGANMPKKKLERA